MYHLQRNIIINLAAYWSELTYQHARDNPWRKEPGTGEVNYKNICKFIREKGHFGVIGTEH
jgi:hydroxypyruvate isomerase